MGGGGGRKRERLSLIMLHLSRILSAANFASYDKGSSKKLSTELVFEVETLNAI